MSKAGIIGDLEIQKIQAIGTVWTEEYKTVLMATLLNRYKTEIIRTHDISDVVMNGDKVLIKWYRRMYPLTDEELLEKWGRDVAQEKLNEKNNGEE